MLLLWEAQWTGQESGPAPFEDYTRPVQKVQCLNISQEGGSASQGTLRQNLQ